MKSIFEGCFAATALSKFVDYSLLYNTVKRRRFIIVVADRYPLDINLSTFFSIVRCLDLSATKTVFRRSKIFGIFTFFTLCCSGDAAVKLTFKLSTLFAVCCSPDTRKNLFSLLEVLEFYEFLFSLVGEAVDSLFHSGYVPPTFSSLPFSFVFWSVAPETLEKIFHNVKIRKPGK